MKSDFKAKFLQHMVEKKQEKGFTLIELLVVIIIIGILSAIALPSFLNQANKAKESEAKQYAGSMNRAQQAYYLENTQFSTSIDTLGLGIKTATTNYTYAASTGTGIVANFASPVGTKTDVLRAFTGGVVLGYTQGTSGDRTTLAVLCQSDKPTVGSSAGASLTINANPSCSANWSDLNK